MAFGLKNRKAETAPPAGGETAGTEAPGTGGSPSAGASPGKKIRRPDVLSFFPEYEYPGKKPEDRKEQKAWKKKVKLQRKKLRAAMKKNGIPGRREFEQTAWELGLSLDNGKKAGFLMWLKWAFEWLKTRTGMRILAGLLFLLLLLLFLLSYLTELAGHFTVNLTADMQRSGFILSESAGFEEPGSRLLSDEVEEINNITLSDVSGDVDEIDGPHNGSEYVAYTFYIKNEGEETADYRYSLNMEESTLGVDKAVWLMLFEDGHQIIYAAESTDGDPEKLFGYREPPFYETAYDKNKQYYQRDGKWGLATTPFVDEHTIAQGLVEDVEPGDFHKYTVVIWLEGNDPECIDDIFGGYARYSMDFDILEEDRSRDLFSGVWRTEYDDYANGQTDGTEDPEETAETSGAGQPGDAGETDGTENPGETGETAGAGQTEETAETAAESGE